MSPSFFESVQTLCQEIYAGVEIFHLGAGTSYEIAQVSFDLDYDGRSQRIHIHVQEHFALIFSYFAEKKDFSADEVFEVASEFVVGINVGPLVDQYSVRQVVFLNLPGWESALRLSVGEVCRSADDLEKALHGRLDRF